MENTVATLFLLHCPSIPNLLQAQISLETQEMKKRRRIEKERRRRAEGEREEEDKGEKGGGGGGEEEKGKEEKKRKIRERCGKKRRRRQCFKFFEPSEFPHQHNFGMHLLSILLFISNKR
jgi:hypothetical protein